MENDKDRFPKVPNIEPDDGLNLKNDDPDAFVSAAYILLIVALGLWFFV
jgi:hypothetical protein